MAGHKKHGQHPHDKMSAMPQFHEGHWQKDVQEVNSMETRYSSEMNECADYKKMVDNQVAYAKKHKAMH